MSWFLRFIKPATKSERRNSKPRPNTLGLSPYRRALGFEALEVRTLLSVAPLNVALISDAVAQAEEVRAAAATGTIAVVYRADIMTTTGLVNVLDSVSAAHGGAPIGHLAIVAHGGPGEIDLGRGDDLSLTTLPGQATELERLRSVLTNDACVDLYSCDVAAGATGKTFVNDLAALTGATVFASDNLVGSVPGADFVFDYSSGKVAASKTVFSVQELQAVPRLCLYSTPQLSYTGYTSGPFVTTPYLVGQCTWYAYGRIQETGLISPSRLQSLGIFTGNPYNWISQANNDGFQTGSKPQVGALAVWYTSDLTEQHVGFVENVSGSAIQVTECNDTPTYSNTPPQSANIVIATATWLHSSMSTSSSTRLTLLPQFTQMTVISGPSAVVNGYQWFEVSGDGYTDDYVAWTDWTSTNAGGAATPSGYQWNITQFKNSAESPWWSSSPTYIYFTPAVTAFNVTPLSVSSGGKFTISYTVADTGTAGLSRVELWRAPDVGGSPGTWVQVGSPNSASGAGPTSDHFYDAPGVGKWWYGVHVVDVNGNWNDEQNSQTTGVSNFAPIQVTVTAAVNQPPSVSYLTTPSGTQSGNVTISYGLADAESDVCSIAVQYSANGGTNWYTATQGTGGNGTSGLASSVDGTSYIYAWNSSADLGSTNNSQVRIRITPTDVGGTGNAVSTNNFTVNNNQPPSVSYLTTPSGTQSGNVTISYGLADAESDVCSIAVQYSANGGTNWYTATQGTGGNGTSGLASSVDGTSYIYAWNSSADLGSTNNSQVRIRITPTDVGGTGNAVSTNNFTVNNNQPPSVSYLTTPSGTQSGNVTISYGLADAESDVCSIAVQYSANGGTNWYTATQGTGGNGTSGLASSVGGTSYIYAWNSSADLGSTNNFQVRIRITPTDVGGTGNAVSTNNFTVNNNQPPSVSYLTTPSGTQSGNVTISYGLADAESDVCSIAVQYSANGGTNWYTATQGTGGNGTSGLASSVDGTSYIYAWNSSADLGSTNNSQVRIRITPTDVGGTGNAVSTNNFTVNNNQPPSVSYLTTPSGTQSGNVTISYGLADAESDVCSIAVQYSANGGTNWYTATQGTGGNGTSGLASSVDGTSYVYAWNSSADLGNTNNSSVEIRITPTDVGGTGNAVSTNNFTVNNNQPPSVSYLTTPSGTQSGNVTISYGLADAESDVCSIAVQYSPNGGTNWYTATQGTGGNGTSGLTSSVGGTSHTYAWNSNADLGSTSNSSVEICITPTDVGGTGNAVSTNNFTVNNYVTWSGGGSDTKWTDAANWGGIAPVATDLLCFSGSQGLNNTNDFPAGTQFNGVTFDTGAGAFVLNGNTLKLGSDIIDNSANGQTTQTINLPIILVAGNRAVNVSASDGDVKVAGGIGESGGHYGINITGSGTVTLSGTSTYTGGTTVSAGTLVLTNSSAIAANTSLAVGAGGASIFALSNPTSIDTTTASDATSPATSGDTSATVAVPSSTSAASSSSLLPSPPAGKSEIRISKSETGSSYADLAWPRLPVGEGNDLPSPPAGKSEIGISKSETGSSYADLAWPRLPVGEGSDLPSPPAGKSEIGISKSETGGSYGDPAWLGQAASDSDSSDQNRKKDVAILALDAVFAQYGQ